MCMIRAMHDHRHHAGAQGPLRAGEEGRLLLALGVSVVAMVAEALGGWWSNSLALLSDAGHMMADAGATSLSARRDAAGLVGFGGVPRRRTPHFTGWHTACSIFLQRTLEAQPWPSRRR